MEGDLATHPNIAYCMEGGGGPRDRNLFSLSPLSPASLSLSSLSRLSPCPEAKPQRHAQDKNGMISEAERAAGIPMLTENVHLVPYTDRKHLFADLC